MSIGSRIKQRREELGLTQPQLAEMVGVSKGSIGNYESNISAPNEKILFKLFTVLKCDANFLYQDNFEKSEIERTLDNHEKEHIKKYRTLDKYGKSAVDSILNIEYDRCNIPAAEEEETPTLRIKRSVYKVSAGRGFPLDDGDNWNYIDVPDTPTARQADFALTISGDSMEPIYHDGDIVLVQSQPNVPVGAVGIFMLDGAGYIKKNGGDRLISLNEQYDDIILSEDHNAAIVGRVIGRV